MPESAPQITPALAAFIAGSQTSDIGEDIRELAKSHILDTLAAIIACRDLEPAVLARNYALTLSGDARRSAATILGTTETASVVDAVFAGAMAGHGAEINDFIPSAFVQPGPAVVSAAIALSEARGMSGEAVLRAVIAGYELAGRVPKAIGLDNLRRAGVASHGIGPLFGTAAAAASILGLAESRIGDVLTYCAQQASGSWQWLLDVEHIEKSFVFAGMGARNGLHAALMVEAGFRGVRGALDHPSGWMNSPVFTGGDANHRYLVEDLGARSELTHTAVKRYPVGGPAQPAVQGLLELLPDVRAQDIGQVRVTMPGRWQAFREAAMPALNIRYLASIILIDRRLDFSSAQSLERMANDAAVRALMDRVDVAHDPAQESPAGAPRTESARIEITLTDGTTRSAYVPHVRGFPSHPMSAAEIEAKAHELIAPRLGAARARQVIDVIRTIETVPSGSDLARLIAA